MRKDVKLGMAIGGGLIVLLVGYLLFAPPANDNKKGTQLALGNRNIIDSGGAGESANATDEKSGAGQLSDDPSSSRAMHLQPGTRPVEANRGTGLGSGAAPKTGDAPIEEDSAPKNGGNSSAPPRNSGARAGKAGQSIEKSGENSKSAANESADHRGHGTPAAAQPRPTFNPNDAYGGGVSSEAVFGNVADTRSAKGDLTSNGNTASNERAQAGATHIVKSGETLSSIASAAYGSANHYPAILRANPNIDPNRLKPGTPLKLPPLNEVKAADGHHQPAHPSAQAPEAKIDPSRQYRVQPGDSLYKISIKVYGKPGYVDKIYEKNKVLIGADNQRLKLGTILELPEKAPAAAASERTTTHSSLSERTADENVER